MNLREQIQSEAERALVKVKSGSVVLPVRTGKTKVGLAVSCYFPRTLVSYPNKSILESWKDDSKKFNINISHITFTTHASLKKHNPQDYDVVIVDEIDQVSEKQWEYLSKFDRIKGLTATPPHGGSVKGRFVRTHAPVVYKKDLEETVGILNKDYRIFVHLVKPSTVKNIPLRNGRMWSEKDRVDFFERKYQSTGIFKDMLMLMRAITYAPSKFEKAKELISKMKRGLVFLETIKQCDETKLPSYHTKNKDSKENLEKFQTGVYSQLATISQLKAGITFPDLDEVIILHCYSSNNKASQKLGRALNYMEGKVATIHVVGLSGTRDVMWIKNGLKDFDQNKIKWL